MNKQGKEMTSEEMNYLIDKNSNLMQLLSGLIKNKMDKEILLLGKLIAKDPISMKKSFNIIVKLNTDDKEIHALINQFEEDIRIEIARTNG